MKECRSCGQGKPLNQFYRHGLMADGHLNSCKDCRKDYAKRYCRTTRGKEIDKKREGTAKRKAWKKKYQRKYRGENKLKYKARTIIGNLLRSEKLKRKPCETCGGYAEAHHEDYNKPLEVIWLCRLHHRQQHGQMVQS